VLSLVFPKLFRTREGLPVGPGHIFLPKPRSFYETIKVGATSFEPFVPVFGIGILIHTSLQRGELGALPLWFSRFNGFPVSR